MSEAAREAIDKATDAAIKDGQISIGALDLIDQAEMAAGPPECNNDKAVTLANQAIELAARRFATDGAKQLDEGDSKKSGSSTVRYKPVSPNNLFAYPDCDFAGRIGKEWESFAKTGPAEFITSSSFLPFLATGLFIPYMSSKISGTSGCEKVAYIKLQQYRFAYIARDNLVRDMANVSGEFVTTMAYLQGGPTRTYTHYAKVTQSHFADIYPRPETDPSKILSNLEYQIAQDSFLSGNCKWAS